jgi:steroid delta-isomerase-like uncharacterized protein
MLLRSGYLRKGDSMATDNTALVRRVIEEIWNKGMLETADQVADKNQVFHDPLMGDLRGLEAFKQYVRNYRAAFPDMAFVIEDIGAVGDKVYFRFAVSGTHKGPFLGVGATNKRGNVTGIAINRIQGGKIVEVWTSYDSLGLIQQLGIAPALDKLRPATSPAVQPH